MFQRILFAIDDTEASEIGLSYTTGLAQEHGASIHVVHINQFIVGGRGNTYLSPREASALVDRAVVQLRSSGIEATGTSRPATAFNLETGIVDIANSWQADLIVLGSRRHRFNRLFGHGVRERVTRLSGLPVLTAPSPLKGISHHRIRRPNGDVQTGQFPSSIAS
jgi:nucleotide-binding universal stress UspA family protein